MDKEVVIIGAGPGGYVAAVRAASLGKKVCLIEDKYMGGVCLNVGCIPSKALIHAGESYKQMQNSAMMGITAEAVNLDFAKLQSWKDEHVVGHLTSGVAGLLKKSKVELIMGRAKLSGKNSLEIKKNDGTAEKINFSKLIIATGSSPIEIGGFKYGGRILDSTGGLNLSEIPSHLTVIGGGYIGCELAFAYSMLGSKVLILEGGDTLLPGFDKDLSDVVLKSMEKHGIDFVPSALAKSANDSGENVKIAYEKDGKTHEQISDYVLVTVGRRPNTSDLGLEHAGIKTADKGLIDVNEHCQTSNKDIYAIGDITKGLALAHKASYEAKVAAGHIAGENIAVDYLAMPAVCFTVPELASAGLSENEAKEKKLDVKISKFPFAINGKAIASSSTEGFVKLISDKASGKLLGAAVASGHASDLIAELTLAIECGLNVEDLALTVHAHPTLAEAVMDAAELALGFPIHY